MNVKYALNLTKWDENVLDGFDKLFPISRVSTCFEIKGNTTGKFFVEYIMVYKKYDKKDQHNSKADYLGIIEFNGTLDDKKGTFVIEDYGVYENSTVKSKLKIKENTGTGELEKITGSGKYYADNGKFIIELDYFL